MRTYIILLRGVNVGGKNILPMKDLKVLLERAGFQSIVLNADDKEATIVAPSLLQSLCRAHAEFCHAGSWISHQIFSIEPAIHVAINSHPCPRPGRHTGKCHSAISLSCTITQFCELE